MGVLTKIGERVFDISIDSKVSIDSKFRKNWQRLELFVVMTSITRVGFPIAYLLLEVDGTNGFGPEDAALTKFVPALFTAFPHLSLNFFTDKERSQISAYRKSFELSPSLWSSHLKREIKQKLSKLQRHSKSDMNLRSKGALRLLLNVRYFRSALCTKVLTDCSRGIELKTLKLFFPTSLGSALAAASDGELILFCGVELVGKTARVKNSVISYDYESRVALVPDITNLLVVV